jgi:hypothetical protein
MAGNLGDIALGSFTGVANMRQQRFDNKAKTRQLGQVDRELDQRDRTQTQKDREMGQADEQLTINQRVVAVSESAEKRATNAANTQAVTTGNDQYIDTLNSAGLLSPDMLSLSKDKFRSGIEGGDATISKVSLDIITNSGELPEGTVASNIQPLPNGRYAITVTNADGSIGAVTEDASSTPQSKVIEFEAGRLTNLGNLYYQTKVANNSSLLSATRIRAELGRVNSDAERNEILKKYENIQQKAAVLDNTPAEGGASRQVAGVLAEADDDVLSAVTDDIAPEENKVKKRGINNAFTQSAQQSDDSPTGPTVEELDASIARAEKNLNEAKGPSRPALRQRLNKLKADRKSMAPQEEIFPIYISESLLAEKVEGKTNAEVDAEINSGEIKATEEEAQQVAQSMKDQGITSLSEMLRLNDKERAIARAVIISMEPDPSRRNAMSDEINNIFETSGGYASISKKDEMDADYNNRRLAQTRASLTQSTKEWSLTRYESALTEAADWTKIVNDTWYGENGDETNLNRNTATIVFRKHAPAMLLKAQNSATPQEAAIRYKVLSAAISTGVAALAAEEEAGIFSLENWNSFWRSNAEENVEATDFDISRVAPVKNGKGEVTGYYYMTPDGDKVNDEIVTVEALQSLSPEIEKMVRDAATINSKKG